MPGELPPVAVFTFGDTSEPHVVGDARCTSGWCGVGGFPRPCKEPGCGGLVHANFGDENYNGDYWLYRQCDRCGDNPPAE